MNRRLYQQTHASWACDYHLVWCPEYRGRVLGEVFIKQELKFFHKCYVNGSFRKAEGGAAYERGHSLRAYLNRQVEPA